MVKIEILMHGVLKGKLFSCVYNNKKYIYFY